MMALKDVESWTGATPARFHAFYVRVTAKESLTQGLSIPNQIARAREIATQRGWTYYRIYVEPKSVKASLWVDKRPALRRLVDDIQAGRVIALCGRHFDRIWRGSEVQTKLLTLMKAHRITLWDFSGQLEYKSAHQKFTIQMLGAVSELEVNVTGERIRDMKRGKAHKGKTGGGPPPFGYTAQSRRSLELREAGVADDEAYRQACLAYPVGRIWYKDDREADIVVIIFYLYTSPENGYGTKRIASYLNERGHKTRSGSPWQSGVVLKIIKNPVYAGFTTFDEQAFADKVPSELTRDRQQRFPGEHPALVTVELWEKAQNIRLTENTIKRVRVGLKSSEIFSLSTIVKCPRCKSHMTGKWSHHSSRRYYQCGWRRGGGLVACDFPSIDAVALQRAVWGWLYGLLSSPEVVLEYVARLRTRLEGEAPELATRANVLDQRQREIHSAVNKYFMLIEQSDDRERDAMLLERVSALRAELQPVEADLAELRAQMAPLPQRTIGVEQVRAYLRKLRDRVDQHPQHQRAIFQEFHREHDLRVNAVSKHEFVVSIALRPEDFVETAGPEPAVLDRLVTTVVTPRTSSRGHEGTGYPTPPPPRPASSGSSTSCSGCTAPRDPSETGP
jgi:site-specific DNA recombinase